MMMVQLESLRYQLSVSGLFVHVVILHVLVLGGLFTGWGVDICNNAPHLVELFGKF